MPTILIPVRLIALSAIVAFAGCANVGSRMPSDLPKARATTEPAAMPARSSTAQYVPDAPAAAIPAPPTGLVPGRASAAQQVPDTPATATPATQPAMVPGRTATAQYAHDAAAASTLSTEPAMVPGRAATAQYGNDAAAASTRAAEPVVVPGRLATAQYSPGTASAAGAPRREPSAAVEIFALPEAPHPPLEFDPLPALGTVPLTSVEAHVRASVAAMASMADLPDLPVAEPEITTDQVGALDVARSDLWARIRQGFTLADLDDPLVRRHEAWYSGNPDYVGRMIERSRRYLYHVVVEVERRGMPLEVALLPMIESGFNPMAFSRSKASGIWQFIPSTGEHFGLSQNWWFDSRRDVLAATNSALDYLEKLHGMFGDWYLALAAYNWGEGSVSRAQAANRARGKPVDYASLRMPNETRNYVPKLQAVKNIVRNPGAHGLVLADIPDIPFFRVVSLDRKIDVKRVAELAEMSLDEFQSLNPHHNRPVIAGAAEHSVLLPYDRADLFIAKLNLHDQPLVSWQAYRLKSGETLDQVANRFQMSVETLKTVNGIGQRGRVPTGHTLLVPVQQPSEEANASLQHAVFKVAPPTPTVAHKVQRGETLQGIAGRYGVSARELAKWNNLTGDRVVIGKVLRVLGDVDSVRAPKVRRTAGVRATGTKKAGTTASRRSASAGSRSTPGAGQGRRATRPTHARAPAR